MQMDPEDFLPSRDTDITAPAMGVIQWQVSYRIQGRKTSQSMRKREVCPANSKSHILDISIKPLQRE